MGATGLEPPDLRRDRPGRRSRQSIDKLGVDWFSPVPAHFASLSARGAAPGLRRDASARARPSEHRLLSEAEASDPIPSGIRHSDGREEREAEHLGSREPRKPQ